MARRISLIVIALIIALLGIVAVPLGLHAASQDRSDFREQTTSAAVTVASIAEDRLAENEHGTSLAQALVALDRQGEQVAIYASNGRLVAKGRLTPSVPSRLVTDVLTDSRVVVVSSAEWLMVIAPVLADDGAGNLGVVALSRSTEPLEHRIDALWTWLTLASVAGLAAAALTAVALARWVSKPLSGLETAAQRLGGGELDARSPADAGPREVRKLASNFNLMAGRLETLVAGHQAMMADVSHQVRTPLAALRLRLDVLALAAPPPLADELAGAQVEIARLSRMVSGLLAVARAENRTSAPVTVPVDAAIKDRASAWLPAADEKPVTIDIDIAIAEPVTARLGEGHLEQILDNVLANAIEAVDVGGHIQISTGQAGDMVRVVIADDGPGMSEQQRRAALRRYVSATPGGTGLGLAIVHRLVTSDGGTIELSDTPGGGLTVTMNLPLASRERPSWRPGAQSTGRLAKSADF